MAELPGAWREKYRHYLGIEPPDDADLGGLAEQFARGQFEPLMDHLRARFQPLYGLD